MAFIISVFNSELVVFTYNNNNNNNDDDNNNNDNNNAMLKKPAAMDQLGQKGFTTNNSYSKKSLI